MTKTASEIEQDLYDLVVVSTLPSSVNGKLYKKGTRPTDSKVEDIIVGFIAGLDSEISRGTVFVNIYVPQILVGGTHIKDIKRTGEVERLLRNFFDTLKGGEYRFSLDGTIQPYEDTNTKQDIVSMRMRYKVFTQN